MTLNLDKNRDALVQAWKQVLDENNSTDWALFGYDGQTYDLNLVSKGDGGLEEMIDDFNSGKIQYALCRVKIKEKNVEKVVLINWQGEGAPLARKGMCANHIGSVKSFFKGVHVTLNARTDEDVEPDIILQTVSKAIAGEGVKMSTSVEPEIGPVGTTYKRVNPQEEINAKAKDDFWRKEEQEEERRKRDEQNRHRKFSVDEVKLLRKESQEYFEKAEEVVQKHQNNIQHKNTPSPQPQKINGNISNGNVNSNGNGILHDSNSSSPVPPQECAAATAAALKASTPMKNNSDLVRQRIKSFDGGSSGPVFPKTANGTSNSTLSPVPPPASFSSMTKSPSPTPTPTSINSNSNSNATPVNAAVNGQSESLSVLKRKQLFESGGASNMSSTIGRKNPADEIKKAQEEVKKKEEQEQKKQQQEQKQNQAAQEVEENNKKKEEEIQKLQQKQFEVENKKKEEEIQKLQQKQLEIENKKKEEEIQKLQQKQFEAENKKKDIFVQVQQKQVEPEVKVIEKKKEAGPVQQVQEEHVPVSKEEPKVISPIAHFQPDVISNSIGIPSPEPQREQHFRQPHVNTNNSPKSNRSPLPSKSPSPQPQQQHQAAKHNQPDIVEDTSVRSGQASYVSASAAATASSPVPSQQDEDSETITIEISPEMGVCARALYDYEAADETEITFDPGEIITNIEKIDEGWWEGLGPRGQYGLFPANYCELLND